MFHNSSSYNVIRSTLNGTIAMDFHNRISMCTRYLYKGLGIKGIQTKQLGGDGGADFYVPSQNLYYAFTAETLSTFKNVCIKLEQDITKLTRTVYDEKKYTGNIHKFIFIYNTHSLEKHNDPNNLIEAIFDKVFSNYPHFDYDIWNVDDYIDFLRDNATEDSISIICAELNLMDYIKSPTALEDVRFLLNKIEDVESSEQSYIRKSTDKKIEDSDLHDIRNYIVAMLTESDFYPKLQKVITDEFYNTKFMSARKKIIDLYSFFSIEQSGYDLFDAIVEEFANNMLCAKSTSKLLVIYIFDSCDIF